MHRDPSPCRRAGSPVRCRSRAAGRSSPGDLRPDLAARRAVGSGGVEILVIADLVSLLRGLHDGSICEAGDGLAIPIDVVRDPCRQAGATITHRRHRPQRRRRRRRQPHQRAAPTTCATVMATGAMEAERRPPRPHPRAAGATDDIATLVTVALARPSGDELRMGRRIRLANRLNDEPCALPSIVRAPVMSGCVRRLLHPSRHHLGGRQAHRPRPTPARCAAPPPSDPRHRLASHHRHRPHPALVTDPTAPSTPRCPTNPSPPPPRAARLGRVAQPARASA